MAYKKEKSYWNLPYPELSCETWGQLGFVWLFGLVTWQFNLFFGHNYICLAILVLKTNITKTEKHNPYNR